MLAWRLDRRVKPADIKYTYTRRDPTEGTAVLKLTLRIYGEPMQYRTPDTRILTDRKGRLIPNRKTGKPWTLLQHPDSRVVKWQQEIIKQVKVHKMRDVDFPEEPLEGPVKLSLWIFLTRPKSVRTLYPQTRPDRTNYLKAAEDPLNGIVWQDDAQVVSGPTELRWAYMRYPEDGIERPQKPGLIITVDQMDTSRTREANAEYKQFLQEAGLEYQTVQVGRKGKTKVKLLEV